MEEIKLLPARASRQIRVFSYGGGVQSNAVLALQAAGELPKPYDVFVFSNVGADSENPETLSYVETVAKPFAARHGIKFVEVQKYTRGKPETLLGYTYRVQKSIPLPVKLSNGAPGNRSCTNDFKIRVVDRWVKVQGYTHAVIGLGISLDEFWRMKDQEWHDKHGTKRIGFQRRREHPLIDLRLSRNECHKIITRAGLPTPPKSSCWFCPFKRPNEWHEMRERTPELFDQAVALEKMINEKRGSLGRDRVYLHAQMIPLDQIGHQLPLFDFAEMDNCESGYCFV